MYVVETKITEYHSKIIKYNTLNNEYQLHCNKYKQNLIMHNQQLIQSQQQNNLLSTKWQQTQLKLNNVTKCFTDIASKYKQMNIQHEELMQHCKSIEKQKNDIHRKYSNMYMLT